MTKFLALWAVCALTCSAAFAQTTEPAQTTQLLWGDTHLHTTYSFDAFLNQNQTADPDTAFRWAKGLPVIHPYHRARVQIQTPLDFLVVSDHAEFMGVMRAINSGNMDSSGLGLIDKFKLWLLQRRIRSAVADGTGLEVFTQILPQPAQNPGGDPVVDPANIVNGGVFGNTIQTETTAWGEIIDAAEQHNQPGTFTALLGWEWSSIPTGANLHRVVITPDDGETAKQFLPFGSDQSQYPEDLWQWFEDTQAATGARFLAIPHNSNISKGYMFADTTLKGEAMTAQYAQTRMKWEPIVEMTQFKGDSETHPDLSPDDEFADFETYPFYIQQVNQDYTAHAGDYVRSALRQGLVSESNIGVNPYKFGMIGSTDSHTGLASAEENNFWGKMASDSVPETKRNAFTSELDENGQPTNASGWNMSASGLSAVWANENTRDSIFQAFQRKEVYATTGPRIAVRVFAGWDFAQDDLNATNFAEIGYAKGVPMGGDLNASDANGVAPQFLIHVMKDPQGANLDRVQVVKGWVDAQGVSQEKVFNAVWSGERSLNADGKLAAVGNTVDLATANYSNSIGEASLKTLWQDPEFNPQQSAFYYVRVLQIPTPRHSLYDAIALQSAVPEEGPATLQERAYTSPIWVTP